MSNTDLDRRAAELLGWEWQGRTIYEEDGLLWRVFKFEQFAPTTDWRQAGPLLEMMPDIELDGPTFEEKQWWCYVEMAASTGMVVGKGDTPQLAIVRAFIAWLEPMTVEERAKALGRTG